MGSQGSQPILIGPQTNKANSAPLHKAASKPHTRPAAHASYLILSILPCHEQLRQ